MVAYDQCRYWATHNSYEGGARNSIPAQLDKNVRCIELDLWDNDFDKVGDFRIGHFKPGHAVALGTGAAGENPNTLLFRDWLKTIADWSAAHDHAALTLVLDLKSDLTDNDRGGDLEDLNQRLEKAFGTRLFTRDDYEALGGWPEAAALRNKIICVLSGNASNRTSYRYCFGAQPALAVDATGNVILAYRSGAGDMRYWSGKAKLPSPGKAGGVAWRRKHTYAWNAYAVSEPAVAMADDGWMISVYRIGPAPGRPGPALLECVVGRLQDDGRVEWGNPAGLGSGMQPTLESIGGKKLRLVYTTVSGKSLRLREGVLDVAKSRVKWQKAGPATGPAFPRAAGVWKGHTVRGLVNARGMILCAFDADQRAVGYRQVAFVERQNEEDFADFVDPVFYGSSAAHPTAIAQARTAGQVARAWWFKEADVTRPPGPENFAATDRPFDPFYAPYMADGGQIDI